MSFPNTVMSTMALLGVARDVAEAAPAVAAWGRFLFPFLVLSVLTAALLARPRAKRPGAPAAGPIMAQPAAHQPVDVQFTGDPPVPANEIGSAAASCSVEPLVDGPDEAESSGAVGPLATSPPPSADEPRAFSRKCRMDMAATRTGLEITVELPGVEQPDVSVQVINDRLTISGHVSFEPDREEKNYRLMERDQGSFSRSIDLPEGVPYDQIGAILRHGLLRVTIPNPTKPIPKIVEVRSDPGRLLETVDGFELSLDLPGLQEGDVQVSVAAGRLTVRGERGYPADTLERDRAACLHCVDLPAGVDADRISASLQQGVLTVVIPAAARPAERRIEIQPSARSLGQAWLPLVAAE